MTNFIKKNLLIVKVGTNTLVKHGELNDEIFQKIGTQISRLNNEKFSVILVSSGAITAGVIADKKLRSDIHQAEELQRYAAHGWHAIIQRWQSAIDAQICPALLTKHELQTQATCNKILDVIRCSLTLGDIFLVNENDVICDEEIRFGDNDVLSAELAAQMARAELFQKIKLVILTTADGFYHNKNDKNTLVRAVANIDRVRHLACDSTDENSRGGMITKLQAAEIARRAGVETFVANGLERDVIGRAIRGEIGTRFVC